MHENKLKDETSPYLLQHARQPVDWYPWGEEAFEKAAREDKPIFLSVGYSTCHWCHVMARESFDDENVAKLMNDHFISIKVDREERPDVDSVYMSVCIAMTGSGGWPMSIFMTPDRKPFYAGTYFPKYGRPGVTGFYQLLSIIADSWEHSRAPLLRSADNLISRMTIPETKNGDIDGELPGKALAQFERSFDSQCGGFGTAPKFPAAHNIVFLLDLYRRTGSDSARGMAELTLRKMYEGGLFDHIGGGFSRYSTDRKFQIPHFEKMLYDNALLIMAYAQAADAAGDSFFLETAEKTADFVLREMTGSEGGFYSALDADSEGAEGLYYAFTTDETFRVLGADGKKFNSCLGITEKGNFGGYSIPHLTGSIQEERELQHCLPKLQEYRRQRRTLAVDDKRLGAWNSLMTAALCRLWRVSGEKKYLDAAVKCEKFLSGYIWRDGNMGVSFRDGRTVGHGYLDDYAFAAFALLELYRAVQDRGYLDAAESLCSRAADEFADKDGGGFYLCGRGSEKLILRPKETYDGAMPSGNSVMAWNLVRLAQLKDSDKWTAAAERQLRYMSGQAARAPMGYAFFLTALYDFSDPPERVTVVSDGMEDPAELARELPFGAVVSILRQENAQYRLLNGCTTYYVCRGCTCMPPENRYHSGKK